MGTYVRLLYIFSHASLYFLSPVTFLTSLTLSFFYSYSHFLFLPDPIGELGFFFPPFGLFAFFSSHDNRYKV